MQTMLALLERVRRPAEPLPPLAVFESERAHFRMRATFKLWHSKSAEGGPTVHYTMFDPADSALLYADHASSAVGNTPVDPFRVDLHAYPLTAYATLWPLRLRKGDVLFIPALWFHNVTSIGFSVALNVFWRSHHDHPARAPSSSSGRRAADDALYSPKDLYGNKDPPAAARACELAETAVDHLSALPEPFRSFYARRCARQLLALCDGDVEEAPPPEDGEGARV